MEEENGLGILKIAEEKLNNKEDKKWKMIIDKNIKDKKQELLGYFRNRATEFLPEIKTRFAETNQIKEQGRLTKE